MPLIPGHRHPAPNDGIRKLTSAEAAYLAGIIDGEGTISDRSSHQRRTIRVSVTNTDAALVEWLRGIGGTVLADRREHTTRLGRKMIFRWCADSWRNAAGVLRQVLPFMIVKREKSAAALAKLNEWLAQPKEQKTHCKSGHPFTPENTGLDTEGARRCRVCVKLRQRRYRAEAHDRHSPTK